jgi:chemotaxis protein methyltransferase CheR
MPLADSDLTLLRSLIARRSGNVLSNHQGYLIEAKLSPVAERLGLPNLEALVAEIKRLPVKYEDSIAEAMTINETSFFRDVQPFDALRKVVVPSILNSRCGSRPLIIWCAASSSGQEPYSIAMTLMEHFPQLAAWNVKILATDISNEMLARTSEGLYNQFEVNRGLPAEMLAKYFRREGTHWRVHPDLRRWVECRRLNLVGPWPVFPRIDVVFMRNVLVYFDPTAKVSVLRKTASQIAGDGYLFLGGGESLFALDVPYRSEACDRTICFRPVNPRG